MLYHAVSNEVSQAPLGPIQLCPKCCPKIPNGNLHRVCSRSLRLGRNIVGRPAQDDRAGEKDTRGNDIRRN